MDVKVVDAGPCRKVLQVQAPAEAVAGEYDQTVKAFAAAARLPGFRPGKAPLKLVERQYARQIESEAKDRLVPRLYREALAQEGLNPVAVIEVKDVVFARADGLGFNVTVDVAPEFTLPTYEGITIKSEPVEVPDAQVDEALNGLRERMARFEPAGDRAAVAHDLLRVDYVGRINGAPIANLPEADRAIGEATDFMVYLAEPEYLPGFTAGLLGAKAGETREVTVTFPDPFRVAAVAGLQVVYQVSVKDVQQRVLPEFDEAFLKQLDVPSEAELRQRVRADLEANARRNEEARQRDQIARYLLEQTPFDLPQSVVEQETRLMVRGMVQEISRRGASRNQIVEQQEQIVDQATRSSTDRVRLTYILTRIAEAEKITVEDAEVDARIEAMAARYNLPPARMREELAQRQTLDNLRGDIRSEKTMTWLAQQARIK